MEKFKVIGVVIVDEVTHTNGEVLELDPNAENVKNWLTAGYIEAFVEPPAPVMIDYVIAKGPVKIGEEIYQQKNALKFAENDPAVEGLLNDGVIMLKADFDALPKEPVSPAPTGTPVTEPIVAAATEPRARYRGKVVVRETSRTVGTQTFKHIVLETGDELDLTDKEYATEVTISYPPQA